MDEQAIADNLKQNIPQSEEFTPAPKPPPDTTAGQAKPADNFDLDELTQYKLHDYFGEQFKPSNEIARQQLQYIYTKVADMVEPAEYGFIVAKIRDLERIIGTTNSDRRIYRLYQWLKLESMRRNIDAEMGALTDA